MGNLFYDEQPKLKQSDLRIGDWVQMRPEYAPVEDENGDMVSHDLLDGWCCDDEVLFGSGYNSPSFGVVIGRYMDGKGVSARWFNGNCVEEQSVPLEAIVKVKEPTKRVKDALEETD